MSRRTTLLWLWRDAVRSEVGISCEHGDPLPILPFACFGTVKCQTALWLISVKATCLPNLMIPK
jgi:hypothetical protein